VINTEHYFVLKDGELIKSLEDLVLIIKNIDKETFNYHVTNEKNDFANWIKYVFKAGRLSDIISGYDYSQKDNIIKAINKHLAERKVLINRIDCKRHVIQRNNRCNRIR